MSISKAKGLNFLGNNDLRKNINLNVFPGFSNSIILPTPNQNFHCHQRLPSFQHNRAAEWEACWAWTRRPGFESQRPLRQAVRQKRPLRQNDRQLDKILSKSKIHSILAAKQNCHRAKVRSSNLRLQIETELKKNHLNKSCVFFGSHFLITQ